MTRGLHQIIKEVVHYILINPVQTNGQQSCSQIENRVQSSSHRFLHFQVNQNIHCWDIKFSAKQRHKHEINHHNNSDDSSFGISRNPCNISQAWNQQYKNQPQPNASSNKFFIRNHLRNQSWLSKQNKEGGNNRNNLPIRQFI